MNPRVHTSAPPRAYRMSSGRRDFIHGRILPLTPERDPAGALFLRAVPFVGMLGMILFFLSHGVN